MTTLELSADTPITYIVVSHDFRGWANFLPNRTLQGVGCYITHNSGTDRTIALHKSQNRLFARAATALVVTRSRTRLATNVSFINFHNTLEQS